MNGKRSLTVEIEGMNECKNEERAKKFKLGQTKRHESDVRRQQEPGSNA